MSLVDLMSGANLTVYAEVALVIFMLVFVSVTAAVVGRKHHVLFERARRMPLDEGAESEQER
jgi:hypothetical protein